jgi:exodeoxyribonuclease-3
VRAKNIGWRIDYVVASAGLRPALRAATLHPDVHGSDHCPAGAEFELP